MNDGLVVAVDVGTGSARAGVYDSSGRLLGRGDRPIAMHNPEPEHAEQSSEDVWRAVAHATRTALKAAGAKPEDVRGVSFDATCSLVVLDARGPAGQRLDHRRGPLGRDRLARPPRAWPRPTSARAAATGC